MTTKKKLIGALNTLKKALDEEYLVGAFKKIEESINSMAEEGGSPSVSLPTPIK